MKRNSARAMLFCLLCPPILIFSGCGGAGGAAATAAKGGIEGSGLNITSAGAVTAKGSIFVNGVEYDLTGATITIDGDPAAEADLGVGHTVIVEGDLNSDGVTGTATRVTAGTALAGTITTVDIAVNRLTILGQTVEVDAATVIVDKIDGQVLGGLAVGDDVEVSGFADSTGVITARRIAPRGPDTDVQLIGYVANLDTAAHRFALNGAVVDYTAAALIGFDSRSLGSAPVRVTVGSVEGNGVLTAATVTFRDLRLPGAQGSAAALQGWVTRFASATDFDVDGHKVVTTATTKVIGPIEDISAVRLDAFIEVKGKLIADGAVEATEIRTNNLISLDSVIWGVDAEHIFANLFRVGGSRCNITDETAVSIDGVQVGVDQLRVGDVATIYEHHVDLEQLDFLNDGDCQIVAVEHNVRGPLESNPGDSASFYVMGQRVWIDPEQAAIINGQTGFDTFASLEVGDIVEVSGHTTAEGDILATGIHAGAPVGAYRVTGFAQDTDQAPGQFRLGALTVTYGDARLDGFGPDGPADGDRVLVVTDALPSAGVLQADIVSHAGGLPRGAVMNIVRLNGLVTRFANRDDFDIEGRRVVPTQPPIEPPVGSYGWKWACDFDKVHPNLALWYMNAVVRGPGEPPRYLKTDCPPGRRIDARGPNLIDYATDIEVSGAVQSIDVANRVLRVAGLDMPLQPGTRLTRFQPSSDPTLEVTTPTFLEDLQAGERVKVWSRSMAGLPVVSAVWLGDEVVPAEEALVKARLRSASEPELVLDGGMRLTVAAGTVFDRVQCGVPRTATAAQFWAEIDPTTLPALEVTGTTDGTTFVTRSIKWSDCPQVVVVDAGPDQSVTAGSAVTLEGNATFPFSTYYLDGETCTFSRQWKQVAGPTVEISESPELEYSGDNSLVFRAEFVAPEAASGGTDLEFELEVTTNCADPGVDTVAVHVTPAT